MGIEQIQRHMSETESVNIPQFGDIKALMMTIADAAPGSASRAKGWLWRDVENAKAYQNTGTAASPTWVELIGRTEFESERDDLQLTVSTAAPTHEAPGFEKGYLWRRVASAGGGAWINEGTAAEASWHAVETAVGAEGA